MQSRSHIARYSLNRYHVDVNIPEILDGLSYREVSTQLDRWALYNRKQKREEFASIFKGKKGSDEFLVNGANSNPDVLRRDLDSMGKILEEGWISRLVRSGNSGTLLAVTGGSLYLISGLITDGQTINQFEKYANSFFPNAANYIYLSLLFAAPLAGMAAGSMLNKHYASKLSEEAQHYLYGVEAEERLKFGLGRA